MQGLEHEGGVYLSNVFGMRQERTEANRKVSTALTINFFLGRTWYSVGTLVTSKIYKTQQ